MEQTQSVADSHRCFPFNTPGVCPENTTNKEKWNGFDEGK